MAGDEGQPDFVDDRREPLIDLDLSDSTELWLIQFPLKQELDFDGQEVSLQLCQDGNLGKVTGTSGKEYEVVSFKSLDADATVFVSSASESKVVGKISRCVSVVHYPEHIELSVYDPNKVQDGRTRAIFERSLEIATTRYGPSMSRSTILTSQNERSKQSNSLRSRSKPWRSVSQVNNPSKSSRKRQSSGSSDTNELSETRAGVGNGSLGLLND